MGFATLAPTDYWLVRFLFDMKLVFLQQKRSVGHGDIISARKYCANDVLANDDR